MRIRPDPDTHYWLLDHPVPVSGSQGAELPAGSNPCSGPELEPRGSEMRGKNLELRSL